MLVLINKLLNIIYIILRLRKMNRYIISFLLLFQVSYGVGIPAGTEIKNIAYLNYTLEGVEMKSISNELIDIVDQKLDMNIECRENSSLIVEPSQKQSVLNFLLVNSGNAEDTYNFRHIEGSRLDFTVQNPKIYKDNGDGIFSIVDDTLVTKVKLLADEHTSLFLVADIPSDAQKISQNGIGVDSLIQGDLVYGESKKLDNFYALVANKADAQSALCSYEVPSIELVLEKSMTLSSDKLYKGTTIHYVISVRAEGVGTVENVVVKDAIPEGTIFVQGSLKLDNKVVEGFNKNDLEVAVQIDKIEQKKESKDILHTVTFDVKVE